MAAKRKRAFIGLLVIFYLIAALLTGNFPAKPCRLRRGTDGNFPY